MEMNRWQNELAAYFTEFFVKNKVTPEEAVEFISTYILTTCLAGGVSKKDFKGLLGELEKCFNLNKEYIDGQRKMDPRCDKASGCSKEGAACEGRQEHT